MRMPLPHRSARAVARAGAAVLIALGLAGGALGSAGGSPAYAEDAPAAQDAAQDPAAATLVVAPREPLLRSTASEYEFTALVTASPDAALPEGSLSLELAPQRVDAADGLDAPFPEAGSGFAEVSVGGTKAGESQAVAVTVPRAEFPLLAASEPGVYRVRAVFTPEQQKGEAAADPVVATSALVWQGVGDARIGLSTVVPFVLPADIDTLPTTGQLDDLAPRFDRLLTAAIADRSTLAIDPRIIAGIRAYGDDAPAAATRFLARLEFSGLPMFLLQFADADPSAQAALGLEELLQPTSLDFVSHLGAFPEPEESDGAGAGSADAGSAGADGGADQAGSDQADPGAATAASGLPTLEQLVDWPQDRATAWPADGEVDTATLALLRANGIDSTVLSSDNVTLQGGPRAKLDQGSALVADAPIGRAARAALGGGSETERAAGLADAATRLALSAQLGVPGVVVALDRGAVADAENPAEFLDVLAGLDWVTPTDVADQKEGTASLRAAAPLEERTALLRAASARESSIDELGPVLVHPEYLTGYQRSRLLSLFATRYAGPDVDFASVASAFRERDEQLLQGVQAIQTENVQLVGSSTQVPLQLRNSLPFDAIVRVRVNPASAALSLSERSFPQLSVPADGNARVLVPVQSRVSSGESSLIVGISDTLGEETVFTGVIPITIRAGIEAVALWTLGILAALLLVFGIWRSVRRRRRRPEAGGGPDDDAVSVEGTGSASPVTQE